MFAVRGLESGSRVEDLGYVVFVVLRFQRTLNKIMFSYDFDGIRAWISVFVAFLFSGDERWTSKGGSLRQRWPMGFEDRDFSDIRDTGIPLIFWIQLLGLGFEVQVLKLGFTILYGFTGLLWVEAFRF